MLTVKQQSNDSTVTLISDDSARDLWWLYSNSLVIPFEFITINFSNEFCLTFSSKIGVDMLLNELEFQKKQSV